MLRHCQHGHTAAQVTQPEEWAGYLQGWVTALTLVLQQTYSFMQMQHTDTVISEMLTEMHPYLQCRAKATFQPLMVNFWLRLQGLYGSRDSIFESGKGCQEGVEGKGILQIQGCGVVTITDQGDVVHYGYRPLYVM